MDQMECEILRLTSVWPGCGAEAPSRDRLSRFGLGENVKGHRAKIPFGIFHLGRTVYLNSAVHLQLAKRGQDKNQTVSQWRGSRTLERVFYGNSPDSICRIQP